MLVISRKHLRAILVAGFILCICAGLIVFARTRTVKTPYSLAEDIPRGALVYAQFENLPELIKQWDESPLKQQYLASTNYQQLQHRHLALKLVSRWEEFNDALGFPLDPATLIASTEGSAAVAIYDIGQLDLVFIAPLSEEKVALTRFFNGKDQFEETEAPDGTPYYQKSVAADRGRQKQVVAFAALNDRFILASNEKLLLRTISNIQRHARKDSLADEPAFKTLSQKLSPHFATVWVDQTKLNDDYYFKHYWLMQNVGQLRNIRAGLFDLERQDGKWIERREFLTAGSQAEGLGQVSGADLQRLYSTTPQDAPFVRVLSLTNDPSILGTIGRDTFFDSAIKETSQGSRSWSWQSYNTDDFYLGESDDYEDSYNRYSYLGSSFDNTIDDPYDARISARAEPGANPLAKDSERQFLTNFPAAILPAHPSAVALATSPHSVDGPLFVEFRKVAILSLQTPGNLHREGLEDSIARAALSQLTVSGPGGALKWENHNDSGLSWRELRIPMLGWEICYALRDHELILANSTALLKNTLAAPQKKRSLDIPAAGLSNLTVIRLAERKEAFDDVMSVLDAEAIKQNDGQNKGASQEFFSGNISSLLNVAADVNRIEIKRSASANLLHEDIEFVMK